MKIFAIVILMCGSVSGSILADTPAVWTGPGSGSHNPAPGGRDVCWSEPGDLDGILGSSEIINLFGLESEIANDFVLDGNIITKATWWGVSTAPAAARSNGRRPDSIFASTRMTTAGRGQ